MKLLVVVMLTSIVTFASGAFYIMYPDCLTGPEGCSKCCKDVHAREGIFHLGTSSDNSAPTYCLCKDSKLEDSDDPEGAARRELARLERQRLDDLL